MQHQDVNCLRPRRICVFLTGALGDFLLALPALRALRQAHAHSTIHLVGNASWLPLASRSEVPDRVISQDDLPMHAGFQPQLPDDHPLLRFLSAFDLIVSWFGDREGRWERTLRRAGAGRVHVIPFHRYPDFSGHVSDYLMQALAQAGLAKPGRHGHPLWPSHVLWSLPAATDLDGQGGGGAVFPGLTLHPGSGSRAKNWLAENFLQVALQAYERWGLPCLVLLGPAEAEQCPFWQSAAGDWLSVGTGLSLVEIAEVLSRTRLYLGNDSGITHLAASLGTPTAALFGPTDPERWAPRGPRVRVIRTSPSTPCRSTGPVHGPPAGSAPENEPTRITPEEVVKTLGSLLATHSSETIMAEQTAKMDQGKRN